VADEDVRAFRAIPDRHDKYLGDLYALARRRLHEAGVRQFFGGQFCTVSEPARFFSYRRDGKTGRMAALIWLE
jgi:copper oxidase (laccase) domain-containing protein